MSPVLWIDKNKFLTDIVEKVFKSKALPIHTLNRAEDFLYLVEDLKIEIIVLDAQTVLDNGAEFRTIYENSPLLKEKKIILLGEQVGLEYLGEVVCVSKPIEPFDFAEAVIKRFSLS